MASRKFLLDLPAEILDIIYGFVLAKERPILIDGYASNSACLIPHDMYGRTVTFSKSSSTANIARGYDRMKEVEEIVPGEDPMRLIGTHTALLRVCKAINQQATVLLLRNNDIVVTDQNFQHASRILFLNANSVNRLTIWVEPKMRPRIILYLHLFKTMRKLRILFQSPTRSLDFGLWRRIWIKPSLWNAIEEQIQGKCDVEAGFYNNLAYALF